MRKKSTFLLLLIIPFVFIIMRTVMETGAAEKRRYTFMLPTRDSAEREDKQTSGFTEAIRDSVVQLGKKSDVDVAYQYANEDEIRATGAVKYARKKVGKGLDFAVLTPLLYIHLKENGIKISPLATYTVNKKKTDKICIYVRKSDGLKGLNDLKGKPVLDNYAISGLPSYDEILYENGINTPKEKYFRIVAEKSRENDLAYALTFKKVDAFVLSGIEYKFLPKDEKRFKDIIPLVCTKEFTNPPVVHYNGIAPEDLEKVKSVWLNMHKDKDFKKISFMFYAINGHFVPASAADYQPWVEYYRMGMKKGWISKHDLYEE